MLINKVVAPESVRRRRTNAEGICRFEDFVGIVGLSRKAYPLARPRQALIRPGIASARITMVPNPARVTLRAEGLPGPEYPLDQKGIVVEGEFPFPHPEWPQKWERWLGIRGDVFTFVTPCRSLRIRPRSEAHRIASGKLIDDLEAGRTVEHRVVLEETPHSILGGRVELDDHASYGRKHCTIELYRDGRRVLRMGNTNNVPADGKVPFAFHLREEGPYDLLVTVGKYAPSVLRGLEAPREDLVIRLSPKKSEVPIGFRVRTANGSEGRDFVAGYWPHQGVLDEFSSGTGGISVRPGIVTFIVHHESGNAMIRNISVREGQKDSLHEVTLSPGATVSGRLVDEDGRPIARRWVHLSLPGYLRMANAYRWLSDLTDDGGAFEISQVLDGAWQLYELKTGIPVGEDFVLPAEGKGRTLGDVVLRDDPQ